MVNWERCPGETVEEFVAALLLLQYPGGSLADGNQITPSRGDRGIDIRVRNGDRYDIYQVKRFTRPLGATQERDVEKSWATFVEQTLPVLPVRSWTLVTPWNPTNDRLDWLQSLTAGHGIPTSWMGRTTLDVMAAERPALVDYYFGDGGRELRLLLAQAFDARREVPAEASGEHLVDAVVDRYRGLATSLERVDPFYRYEIDVRAGRLRDQPWDADVRGRLVPAFIHYEQIDAHRFMAMRLLPRCTESLRLRPIELTVQLTAEIGSPEHQGVEDFLEYGAPFHDVQGTVANVTGPPGIDTGSVVGRFTMMPASNHNDVPDFEARLLGPDGTVLHTVELVDVTITRGARGEGMRIAGRDRGGILKVQLLLNGPEQHTLRLNALPAVGRTPAEVLPGLRLVADLAPGTELTLAVRGGKRIGPAWAMGESSMAEEAKRFLPFAEALSEIQAHTYERITIPNVDGMSSDAVARIMRAGRLLRGEQLEVSWNSVSLTVNEARELPTGDGEHQLLSRKQLSVPLYGREIALDMEERVLYRSIRLVAPTETRSLSAGDTITFEPAEGATAHMIAVPLEESLDDGTT